MRHKFMTLSKVKEQEPEMRRLKVSEVARSPRGFLSAYKRAGSPDKLSEAWKNKREGFIARTKVQFDKNPTERRKLALQAWAYNPKRKS